MKTALCEVQKIFESITGERACIPATLLYNEGWLLRLATAGNTAIHDPQKFDRKYSADKLEEVLINTRKVLEQLYRMPV